MPRARGSNATMSLAFEATYGTPPNALFFQMPFVSSQLGAEQGLIESDLLGQGRAPADPSYDVVTNDGDVVVPLSAQSIGHWLMLLLGSPTMTTANSLNTHVFVSGAPALRSASIELGLKDVSKFSTSYGARANTFAVQMRRSGLASATIGLIAKGETVPTNASNAGNPQAFIETRFASASGQVLLDGVEIGEVMEANFSFSNNMEKIETIRPDGEIADADPGMPSLSLGLTTTFADVTLYNKAASKTPIAVKLIWRAGAMSLTLEMPRLFLSRTKRPVTGPGGIQQAFNAIGSTLPGQPLLKATLVNDFDYSDI